MPQGLLSRGLQIIHQHWVGSANDVLVEQLLRSVNLGD